MRARRESERMISKLALTSSPKNSRNRVGEKMIKGEGEKEDYGICPDLKIWKYSRVDSCNRENYLGT